MRQSFEMDTVLGLANLMADNPEAEEIGRAHV